jgi:hypothetical protein
MTRMLLSFTFFTVVWLLLEANKHSALGTSMQRLQHWWLQLRHKPLNRV